MSFMPRSPRLRRGCPGDHRTVWPARSQPPVSGALREQAGRTRGTPLRHYPSRRNAPPEACFAESRNRSLRSASPSTRALLRSRPCPSQEQPHWLSRGGFVHGPGSPKFLFRLLGVLGIGDASLHQRILRVVELLIRPWLRHVRAFPCGRPTGTDDAHPAIGLYAHDEADSLVRDADGGQARLVDCGPRLDHGVSELEVAC